MLTNNWSCSKKIDFSNEYEGQTWLSNLYGQLDEHLQLIESHFQVQILARGANVTLSAHSVADLEKADEALHILAKLAQTQTLTPYEVQLQLQSMAPSKIILASVDKQVSVNLRKGVIRGRGERQNHYLSQMTTHDINFGVGPAGTGKTYLAVAAAVDALEKEQVRRLILVRPAVEAGERLGFLPGDMTQKVDPYLRPLYDALYEMLGFEKVAKFIERHVIEIAPLAFMRGRTLNDAFIILDEAQNTTIEQMKMFLTRIGFGSTAVITGDPTQVDLPKHITSGLSHALTILQSVEGIAITHFTAQDVVRHPMVQRIIRAYEAAALQKAESREH